MDTKSGGEARERLVGALEKWYVWLISDPTAVALEADKLRMNEPVYRLRLTHDWISASSMAKTDWFLREGYHLHLDRLEKGDFDLYE